MEAKISAKGWVVIPAELRRKYGLTPGTKVAVVDYGGVMSLVPVADDPIAASAGTLRDGSSLTRAVVAEHKAEVYRARSVRKQRKS